MNQLERIEHEFKKAKESLSCGLRCKRQDRARVEVLIGKMNSLLYSYSNPRSVISEDEFVQRAEGILSKIYNESKCSKKDAPCSRLELRPKSHKPSWYSSLFFWRKS